MSFMDHIAPYIVPLFRGLLTATQTARRSQFKALPATPERILFLGDSITEQGIWEEWFPELPTLNRGIGGETVAEVLARVDTAIMAPRAISLLVGTNDLGGLGKSRKVETIAQQMCMLVAEIRRLAPDTPLFINSVLPRSAIYRDRIGALNEHYKQIAADFGATFLDIWPVLANSEGAMRPELTTDGIHLNGEGYRLWTDVLRPHLAKFGS